MIDTFSVEIISPEKLILKAKITEAVIPSYEGEMGILKNHIPLITFLRPGIIKILGETNKNFFVEEGTVEFSSNNLLILTSNAENLANINKTSLNNLINDAEKKINNNQISDKERYLLSYKINTLKNIS